MRTVASRDRIEALMRELGRAADTDGAAYFTGGATAVLVGWRETTIDVDLAFVPETDALLRALPALKEELHVNVELASPGDFIPLAPGWEERSLFVGREGRLSFFHFDPSMQALAKLERAHAQDLADVDAMLARGLVDPASALRLFEAIEPELYRFPAVDPASFKRRVEDALSLGAAGG